MSDIHEEKIKELEEKANEIRQTVIKMLTEAGSGHTAGSLGMADIFTAFYFHILNHNPKNPDWEERDRLILSNGHIAPILYATMAHAGYFPLKETMTLRKFGARLQGHPERERLPGIETTSGPLGSGLSQAAGIAYAAKLDGKSHTVYALMGDGELNEGSCWEAFLNASKFKLDNLLVMVDRNDIQIDGYGHHVLPLDPISDKFKAFGFKVFQADGNDMTQVIATTGKALKTKKEMPRVILWKTVMGKGVDFMQNLPKWHGIPPNAEQAAEALNQLQAERRKIEDGKI